MDPAGDDHDIRSLKNEQIRGFSILEEMKVLVDIDRFDGVISFHFSRVVECWS